MLLLLFIQWQAHLYLSKELNMPTVWIKHHVSKCPSLIRIFVVISWHIISRMASTFIKPRSCSCEVHVDHAAIAEEEQQEEEEHQEQGARLRIRRMGSRMVATTTMEYRDVIDAMVTTVCTSSLENS